MTAESARSRTIEIGFQKIYAHARVQADAVIQSYDQAKRITKYAEVFPNNILADRIEKLEKRTNELRNLIQAVEEMPGRTTGNTSQEFLEQAIQGTAPRKPDALANTAKRIREISKELKIQHGRGLLEIVSLCANGDAIRAAKDGVTIPPIKKGAKGTTG